PFRNNNKMMLHAYFRARGVTEKILMDWGTLPCLAIQHYYSDGVITTSQPPQGVQEVDITIYPNRVQYTKNFGTSMKVMTLQPHAVSYFLLKARMSFCQSLKCCEVYWRLMVFFYIACLIRIHFLYFSQYHTNQIKYILVFHLFMN